ncbi:MAG: hypothetical protein IPO40_13920 [Fibrobacteres bacterium]|nr:hypothetical protein [Fibrobacterota bacterium]
MKPGPAITLSLASSSPYATSFTLKGTVGKSGSVSVYTTLTLDGVDRSNDFSLPPSKMVTAPYDLSGISLYAKSSARPGDYLLTVTATDSLGTSRATCTLSVRYKSLEVSANSSSIFPGDQISLSGTTHFAEDFATLSFQVVPQEATITLPATIQVTNGSWPSTSVATSTSTPLGNYRVVVALKRSNGTVDTVSVPLTVVEKTSQLISKGSIAMGSQLDPTNGSYLDVANATVWSSGAGKPYQTIDVIFFKDASGTPSFLSPAQTASDSLGNMSAWTTKNRTIIVDAGTATPASAEAIKLAIGSSTAQKAAVVSGHWYALRLSTGQYAAIKVASLTSTGITATVEIYNSTLFDRSVIVAPAQVAMGTQTSTTPSFLDVADISLVTAASKSYNRVDLVFFKDATGTPTFLSPSEAANQGLGALSSWATKNHTIIVDAGTSGLATLDAVKAAIGSSSSQKAPVVSGHVYALKLSSGSYAAIKVVSLSSSGTDVILEVTN